MVQKNIFLILIVLFCCFAIPASAEVSFTNDIDLYGDSVTFTLIETYTDENARDFRDEMDIDGDGVVNASETGKFEEDYLSNGGVQFLEYIMLDNGSVQLTIDSIGIHFEGAEGQVNSSVLNVTTTVQYGLDSTISSGEHSIWVLGHPLINKIELVLPDGTELVSYDGLDNSSQSFKGGRVVLEGASGIRSFMNGDMPAFEYAVHVDIREKPFYKNKYFLPILIIIEIMLASIALYIIRMNKNK
ncbi:hypothetical protein [Methanolobus halotolerans]|nr:hypothetical protein [Methanolobus halotolerans]